ncbi:putative protein in type-1 retrotransposable element R1DM [Fusarium oxysporum f. sp. albedinis]|nr:putative protein in type-1 retrotransposable element R1DM [Fusarium oxysporum f. sp. albedinis]
MALRELRQGIYKDHHNLVDNNKDLQTFKNETDQYRTSTLTSTSALRPLASPYCAARARGALQCICISEVNSTQPNSTQASLPSV